MKMISTLPEITNSLPHPETLGELFAAARMELPFACGAGIFACTADTPIIGFEDDSRRIGPGMIFVAVKGEEADGHRFIADAIAKGAAVVIAEHIPEGVDASKVLLQEDTRVTLANLAQAYWGNPSQSMTVIGVTGTNGKTTTVYLVEAMLAAVGRKPAVFTTVENRFGTQWQQPEPPTTTPGALFLAQAIAGVRALGADSAVMEVSSHALSQRRVDAIEFEVGLITNLTQDHLDYHKTMEEYREAKRLFFTRHKPRVGIFNFDDPTAREFAKGYPSTKLAYSLDAFVGADIFPESLSVTSDGIEMMVHFPSGELQPFSSPMLGRYNASNLLAAASIGTAIGLDPAAIAEGLEKMPGAPGRFEAVNAGQPFSVYVDYAHTPDAVENLLKNVRPLTRGHVIIVLGCGGDRDPGKRPIMGKLMGELADFSIITDDNPRTEDPQKIAAAMEEGIRTTAKRESYWVVLDRRMAIRRALELAHEGDSVVIAGKGHEDYQIIGKTKHQFDDREIVREVCAQLYPRKD